MDYQERVTLSHIARRVGVNVSTVSLALKDNPRISLKRRTEIQAMARQLDYQVNTHAVTLAHLKHRPKSISAALAWINHWPKPDQLRAFRELDEYWQGAHHSAQRLGYRLEEFRLNEHKGIKWLARTLRSRGIYGGLIVPTFGNAACDWTALLSSQFYAVKLGFPAPGTPFKYHITSDQAINSRLAYQRAELAGYRRIGFVTRVNDINQNSFRAGYLVAQLSSMNATAITPLILSWSGEKSNVRELDQWLRRHNPDSILTNIGNLKSLLSLLNKRVPHDIGLIGTNILDVNATAGIDPQPFAIGKAAVEWLISLLQQRDPSFSMPYSQLLIAGKWVEGNDLPSISE